MTDFEDRTDALAAALGIGVDDLADVLGVSRASLYGYRKGRRSVSGKAWAKLERAERDAGIGVDPIVSPALEVSPVQSDDLREQLNRIESLLEALLQKTGESRTTSSRVRGEKF